MNIKLIILLGLTYWGFFLTPYISVGQSIKVDLGKHALNPGETTQVKVTIEGVKAGSDLHIYKIDPRGAIIFDDTTIVIEEEMISSGDHFEKTFSVFVTGTKMVKWKEDFMLVGEFGNSQPSIKNINGVVFEDSNRSKKLEGQEKRLENVEIEVVLPSGLKSQIKTSKRGEFFFTASVPGQYLFEIKQPPGWEMTTDSRYQIHVNNSDKNEAASELNFGLLRSNVLPEGTSCKSNLSIMKGGPITLNILAPEDGTITSTRLENIPLIATACDRDHALITCQTFIGGNHVPGLEWQGIEISDYVSYSWSIRSQHIGGKPSSQGLLIADNGPATFLTPPNLPTGESFEAKVQVVVSDELNNDKSATAEIEIQIQRTGESEFQYFFRTHIIIPEKGVMLSMS